MAARIRTHRDRFGKPDLSAQRRPRFKAVLEPLGLWNLFRRMPQEAQNLYCRMKYPDPVLEFDDSVPKDPDFQRYRKTLESQFLRAAVEVEGVEVTVRDFFAIFGCLRAINLVSASGRELPRAYIQFKDEVVPLTTRWFQEYYDDIFLAMHEALISPLVARSQLDARLLNATCRADHFSDGRFLVRFTVSANEPQMRRVTIDGGIRPMYRVGTSNGWEGVRWLSWDAKQLGSVSQQHEYPVYVQSHALRQLQQRVNLPWFAPYLHYWLYESLAKPRIVDRHGGDLLVEYRVQADRLGYLVVTPLDDLVAVRTFKFLTMSNTPEARQLEKQLRLTRREVDWLGLHELAAFTQTDLSHDPILREMLDACGCGHLFSLQDTDYAPQPKPLAAELRRYLRLAA